MSEARFVWMYPENSRRPSSGSRQEGDAFRPDVAAARLAGRAWRGSDFRERNIE
jgi:hypothetical protein